MLLVTASLTKKKNGTLVQIKNKKRMIQLNYFIPKFTNQFLSKVMITLRILNGVALIKKKTKKVSKIEF